MLFFPTRYDHLGNGYLQYYAPHRVWHPGADLNWGSPPNADLGQDVVSPTWGIVEFLGTNEGLGNFLVICHPHHGVWTRYLHLQKILIPVGQKAAPNQVIGKLGKTGTTNPHLHFEVLNQKGRDWIRNWSHPYGRYPSGLSRQTVASMWLDPLAWVRNSEHPKPQEQPSLQQKLTQVQQELATASGPRRSLLERLFDRLSRLVQGGNPPTSSPFLL